MNKQQKQLLVSSAVISAVGIGINLLTIKYVNGKENPGKFLRYMRWSAKVGRVAGPVLNGLAVAASYMMLESPVDEDTQTYELVRMARTRTGDQYYRVVTGTYPQCMKHLHLAERFGIPGYSVRVVDGTQKGT